MIQVEELLYEIDLKLNKQATHQHQNIPDEDKLVALNNAQIKLIVSKLGENNTYQLGFDAFKKRYEDLQILVESFHDHPLIVKEVDEYLHKWEASLLDLSPKYMFYIDAYALASKAHCKDIVIAVNNDLTKHQNVQTLIANSNYKPSFEYQETFNTISNDKIEIYSDGTFAFSKVFVAYLRYPKKIDIEGYINLQGEASIRQDCELASYLKEPLVDFAIAELAMSTDNQAAVQYTQTRKQEHE